MADTFHSSVPPSQIHDLVELIADKEKELALCREKAGLVTESELTVSRDVEEAERLLNEAQEEWQRVERERSDVIAQYEACQHNKVQHTQAEEFRKAIETVESEIQKADNTIVSLENKLHSVSRDYKNERERRMLMLSRFKTMVDELREIVTKKIEGTISDCEVDAKETLRILAEISRERESEINQWEKYSKEMAAIVLLKRTRTEELQKESEKRVHLLAEVKSQEIRELVEKCEAERGSIITDIQVLQEVHRKQLEQLKTVRLSADRTGRMERDPKAARTVNVPAEKFLIEKLQKHEQSREELEGTLRQLALERQKLQTTMVTLRQEMENDASKHARMVGGLEASMNAERSEILSLERDNRQLRDLCDSLTATIQNGQGM